MFGRNRSEGWQYAKKSGHENERLIAELTQSDKSIQNRLLKCAHLYNVSIEKIEYGGLYETDVDCILGGKTKSKTDMWLYLSNGKKLNISIKKDDAGQVFLIGIERFINGFEKQYNTKIHDDVKRALSLYFGSAEDTLDIIHLYSTTNKELEERKHRLVAETLKAYDQNLYECLPIWFNEHIVEIFDYCFSKGLSLNSDDWAQIVWYKNMLGEKRLDEMIYIPDIVFNIPATVKYGINNGGSTIQLPFGFVQWHSPRKVIPGNIQFHHSYKKMIELI